MEVIIHLGHRCHLLVSVSHTLLRRSRSLIVVASRSTTGTPWFSSCRLESDADDDRQWVVEAAKSAPGVLDSNHLVDAETGNGLSIAATSRRSVGTAGCASAVCSRPDDPDRGRPHVLRNRPRASLCPSLYPPGVHRRLVGTIKAAAAGVWVAEVATVPHSSYGWPSRLTRGRQS